MKERAALVAQSVRHLPVMQEMWVRSLGQEDPLEKSMETPSSILVWRLPWTEESGGCGIWVHKELDMTASEHIHTPRLKL